MTIRAAIYVRQSLDRSEGIQRQLDRTRQEAARREWDVVAEYRDNDVSASKYRGPKTQWAKMLRDAEAGLFTHVIAVDLDRLIRSNRDLITLIDLGLRVVTVDGEIDLATADGEFRATMLAAIARFEVRRKGERQKRANLARSAAGKVNPGRRRYGFESDGVTIREEEAQHVRWMFDHVADGGSIRSVVTKLQADGIAPTTGTEWTTRRVRDMLNSPFYAGAVRHNGVVTKSDVLPEVVDPERAEYVRNLIADPARKTHKDNKTKYLMSGLARCGECDSVMYYMRGYLCKAKPGHVHIKREFLDQRVMEEVFQWVVEHDDATEETESARLVALVAEAAEIRRKRAAAQELALMDGVDLNAVRKTIADLAKRLGEVEEAIASERAQQATAGVLEAVRGDWYARRQERLYAEEEQAALDAWPEYWAGLGLDRQRDLVRAMFTVRVESGRTIERVRFDWLS